MKQDGSTLNCNPRQVSNDLVNQVVNVFRLLLEK